MHSSISSCNSPHLSIYIRMRAHNSYCTEKEGVASLFKFFVCRNVAVNSIIFLRLKKEVWLVYLVAGRHCVCSCNCLVELAA